MRESAWLDFQEPCLVRGPSDGGMLFMGAQVGWSPARESKSVFDCSTCGGLIVFLHADPDSPMPDGFDRRRDFDAEIHGFRPAINDPLHGGNGVCASCMRWMRDHGMPAILANDFQRRGTNEPIELVIPVGGTIPISAEHCKAFHDEQSKPATPVGQAV